MHIRGKRCETIALRSRTETGWVQERSGREDRAHSGSSSHCPLQSGWRQTTPYPRQCIASHAASGGQPSSLRSPLPAPPQRSSRKNPNCSIPWGAFARSLRICHDAPAAHAARVCISRQQARPTIRHGDTLFSCSTLPLIWNKCAQHRVLTCICPETCCERPAIWDTAGRPFTDLLTLTPYRAIVPILRMNFSASATAASTSML